MATHIYQKSLPLINPVHGFSKLHIADKKHPEAVTEKSNKQIFDRIDLNRMKTLITFITILFCSILFLGCSKNSDTPVTPEAKLAALLTGSGNRYWHLSKQSINNVQQSLTDFQKTYTKTYTVDPSKTNAGVFTNSDGTTGTWTITGSVNYVESFVSAGGVGLQLTYLVNNITDNSLDIQYSANNKLVEEVYYAY